MCPARDSEGNEGRKWTAGSGKVVGKEEVQGLFLRRSLARLLYFSSRRLLKVCSYGSTLLYPGTQAGSKYCSMSVLLAIQEYTCTRNLKF